MDSHEIADVFPMLDETQLAELADRIKANGLRCPIVRYEGKILDGRNRYHACRRAGVEPTFIDFDGDYHAAIALAFDANISGRDRTPAQRAMWAEKLATLARGRPTNVTGSREPFSQRDAAARFGVGRESVKRARKVRERGVPELADAVERGELPLKPAADLAQLPEPEQRAAVAAGRDAMREAARAAARTRPLTDMQVKARQGREALTILNGLTTIATDAKGYAERLASGDIPLTPDQLHLAATAADHLASSAAWIKAAVSGDGFSDEALARLA